MRRTIALTGLILFAVSVSGCKQPADSGEKKQTSSGTPPAATNTQTPDQSVSNAIPNNPSTQAPTNGNQTQTSGAGDFASPANNNRSAPTSILPVSPANTARSNDVAKIPTAGNQPPIVDNDDSLSTPPLTPEPNTNENRVIASGNTGTEIGDKIPEIVGDDVDGVKFSLSDYSGKVVMLDFWGDW